MRAKGVTKSYNVNLSLINPTRGESYRLDLSTKGTRERELEKWLHDERKHFLDVDRMLLEQSRQHRALQKRTRITRFVVHW
jgi:hypothetical protein